MDRGSTWCRAIPLWTASTGVLLLIQVSIVVCEHRLRSARTRDALQPAVPVRHLFHRRPPRTAYPKGCSESRQSRPAAPTAAALGPPQSCVAATAASASAGSFAQDHESQAITT